MTKKSDIRITVIYHAMSLTVMYTKIYIINSLARIPKIVNHCDIKHVMTLLIKTITPDLNIHYHQYHNSSCQTCCDIIMSVSTFKTDGILYLLYILFLKQTMFLDV